MWITLRPRSVREGDGHASPFECKIPFDFLVPAVVRGENLSTPSPEHKTRSRNPESGTPSKSRECNAQGNIEEERKMPAWEV
jgi:hypothetical protein